jgi:hypothetical protein
MIRFTDVHPSRFADKQRVLVDATVHLPVDWKVKRPGSGGAALAVGTANGVLVAS